MEIRKMSESEIAEELAKVGGYDRYKQSMLEEDSPLKPMHVEKSLAELTVDRFTYYAKREGLSFASYLTKHPELYEEYKKLVG
jgi:hypothetical protein